MNKIDKLTTDYYKVLSVLYNSQTSFNGKTFCPITQAEIGQVLSISKPTVIKIFKELKSDGFIIQDDSKIGRYYLTQKALTAVSKISSLEEDD